MSPDWVYILAEFPQWFIFGPLLFLLYFNEIMNGIVAIIRRFFWCRSMVTVCPNTYLLKLSNWAVSKTLRINILSQTKQTLTAFIWPQMVLFTCAGSESFVRGGPTLTTLFLFDEGREWSKYHYKRAIIGPPAKHHINGVLLAFRWWTNIGMMLAW